MKDISTEPVSADQADAHTEIPGTDYLIDADRKLSTKHLDRDTDIVLIPAPSDHPDDPLNWSRGRKLLSTFCLSLYILLLGITTAAIYSALVPISEATGLSVNELNQGTGYMFLLFGWGCVFWQPIALQFGKRIVFLISLAATLAIMVWQPHTTTSGQYLASKILQGFFGAPIESLCEISIADVYFQHERGRYLGLYALLLAGSNYLAPVLMGFINEGQGWQWIFYWCAIFVGIAFVFNFFFMEETNWDRVATFGPHSSSSNKLDGAAGELSAGETASGSSVEIADVNKRSQLVSKRTYLQKLSIFQRPRRFFLWKIIHRPFLYFSLPAVVWSGFSYGSSLIWFNVLNGTASSFFSGPPYNFGSSIVGLTFVSPLIGTGIATFITGYIGDKFVLKVTRQKQGIWESEYRLWLFLIAVVITPFGLLLWGIGYAHQVNWFGLVFAMGLIGAQAAMGISLSVTYAIDSYRDVSGQAMVTVILIRNTMSFAIGYGITPWVTNMGPQNAFIVAAFAGMAQTLSFLPMVKWGKSLRRRSAKRYRRFVEQEKKLGLSH